VSSRAPIPVLLPGREPALSVIPSAPAALAGLTTSPAQVATIEPSTPSPPIAPAQPVVPVIPPTLEASAGTGLAALLAITIPAPTTVPDQVVVATAEALPTVNLVLNTGDPKIVPVDVAPVIAPRVSVATIPVETNIPSPDPSSTPVANPPTTRSTEVEAIQGVNLETSGPGPSLPSSLSAREITANSLASLPLAAVSGPVVAPSKGPITPSMESSGGVTTGTKPTRSTAVPIKPAEPETSSDGMAPGGDLTRALAPAGEEAIAASPILPVPASQGGSTGPWVLAASPFAWDGGEGMAAVDRSKDAGSLSITADTLDRVDRAAIPPTARDVHAALADGITPGPSMTNSELVEGTPNIVRAWEQAGDWLADLARIKVAEAAEMAQRLSTAFVAAGVLLAWGNHHYCSRAGATGRDEEESPVAAYRLPV